MGSWVRVGKKSEFGDGDVRGFDLDGMSIAVYRYGEEYFATSNICTHAFALLSDGFLDDCIIECPLHAGRFDIRTGKAQGHPVVDDLTCYEVKIDAEEVWVGPEQAQARR
jgi:nitrite reductase/ring-hydroxylating ferredoxin subunit